MFSSNYGPRINRPRYGSRGTRLSLEVLQEIFSWVGVLQHKKLRVVGLRPPPQPLYLMWSREDERFRIVVKGPEKLEDVALMRFTMMPAYAGPVIPGRTIAPEFAFNQLERNNVFWVSWDIEDNRATRVRSLATARLGQWRPNSRGGAAVIVPWKKGLQELIVDTSQVPERELKEFSTELTCLTYQALGGRKKEVRLPNFKPLFLACGPLSCAFR